MFLETNFYQNAILFLGSSPTGFQHQSVSCKLKLTNLADKSVTTKLTRKTSRHSVAEDNISFLTKINTRLAGGDVRPVICQPQVLILSKTLDSKNKTFYIFLSMSFKFLEKMVNI